MKSKDPYPPADVGDSSNLAEDDICQDDNFKFNEDEATDSEIVIDDEAEEYEEETTGVKVKYTLKEDEIVNFIKSSFEYKKNSSIKKRHTLAQTIICLLIALVYFVTFASYYLWLLIFPICFVFLIWTIPALNFRRVIADILRNKEFSVEIFPDKIDVVSELGSREILLDGSYECAEFGNMILISSNGKYDLIIPIRAIEPEFRADVQAMIFAGAVPR